MRAYEFTHPGRHRAIEWDHDSMTIGSANCPICGPGVTGVRSGLTIMLREPPTQDVSWTWLSECIVTERLKQVVEASGITGCQFKPVTVTWKREQNDGASAGQLWELRPNGWGGLARPESGIRLLSECPSCGRLRYSMWRDSTKLIDESQWDGSDLFLVWPLPVYIFATDKFRAVMLRNKIRGAQFIALESMTGSSRLDPSLDTLSPGRLRNYLPEDRAHLYGDRLGIF
jgi:hypothetical protein